MSTQFISRVERDGPAIVTHDSFGSVGLRSSSSNMEGAFKKGLPGFAPFSSNTKRMVVPIGVEEMPAPGSYNVSQDLAKTSFGIGAMHAKSDRFDKKDSSVDMSIPGPGKYSIPSIFKKKKRATSNPQSKNIINNEALIKSLGAPTLTTAPSIPTRFQGYGYEHGPDGRLQLQDPLYPVYTGKAHDAVGPCEYDPKTDVKFKSVRKADFTHLAPRESSITAKAAVAPGPGYYNLQSSFDNNDEGTYYNDTNFIMQLNAARKRQSAIFESKTMRDSFMSDVIRKLEEPGPGQYNIPPVIQPKTVPAERQNFSFTGERFKDPTPRSLRNTTAPGAYSPMVSDFEQSRMKILKQKKMASHSNWAQHIAFTSTEARFHDMSQTYLLEVPPSTTYNIKQGLSDLAPKETYYTKASAFGGKDERFKPQKTNYQLNRDPYALLTAQLTKELETIIPSTSISSPKHNNNNNQGYSSSNNSFYQQQQQNINNNNNNTRPKYTSPFAPSSVDRFRPVKTPPGPPPGYYDTLPRWDDVGCSALMVPPSTNVVKKKGITDREKRPGPGQYQISRRLGSDWRNPKNIMLSTSERDIFGKPKDIPGPGEYEIAKDLIRPSHNVLLSDI